MVEISPRPLDKLLLLGLNTAKATAIGTTKQAVSLRSSLVVVIRRCNHCDSDRDSPNSQTKASPRKKHLVYLVEIARNGSVPVTPSIRGMPFLGAFA